MKRLAVVLATLGFAAPVYAGGPTSVPAESAIITAAPVVSISNDWTGAYGGIQLGYGDLDLKSGGTKIVSANGANGGVQLGYRWDTGNVVWGVEASVTGGHLKGTDIVGDRVKVKNRTDLKGQVGYDWGDSLIYATAGASWAKVDVPAANYKRTFNGWVAGVGYDYQLQNNWVVGGELLYNHYKKDGLKLKGTTFALRANYRF